MAKPTDDIEWGTDALADVVEPAGGSKLLGWIRKKKPPAGWLNWAQRAYWRWISWYDTVLGTDTHETIEVEGDASATRAAITATGSNGNPGATISAPDTTAIYAIGGGTGDGISAGGGGGGGGGRGIYAVAGGNAVGVDANGSGTGAGLRAAGPGSGAGAADDAIVSVQNIHLSGSDPASNPASEAFKNRLTTMNIPKAWGNMTLNGGGGFTNRKAFNCTIAYSGGVIRVTLLTTMADTLYCVMLGRTPAVTGGAAPYQFQLSAKTQSTFDIQLLDSAGGAVNMASAGFNLPISFLVFGDQL